MVWGLGLLGSHPSTIRTRFVFILCLSQSAHANNLCVARAGPHAHTHGRRRDGWSQRGLEKREERKREERKERREERGEKRGEKRD